MWSSELGCLDNTEFWEGSFFSGAQGIWERLAGVGKIPKLEFSAAVAKALPPRVASSVDRGGFSKTKIGSFAVETCPRAMSLPG